MKKVEFDFDNSLCLGTVIYGSLVEMEVKDKKYIPIFVIEDIYYHKGIQMKSMLFGQRLGYIEKILEKHVSNKKEIILSLPPIWCIEKSTEYECIYEIPDNLKRKITEFQIHHIQYRALYDQGPYMNVFNNNSILHKKPATYIPIEAPLFTNYRMDPSKSQYRLPTVFLVTPDIQFDVYHLYAYGKASQQIYYNVAYIPSYQTSCMMNSIFRKINENKNLDAIEESEDEEEFEDMREDKYVDLQKTVQMECIYLAKFKKWVPKRIVNGQKIVHISLL